MSDLPATSLQWLSEHHGAITTRALTDHGVGRSTRDRLVDAGVLAHAAKGVLVIASSPDTMARRCAVLCLAHPRAFVTGPTAGMLAGLRRMPTASTLHLAVRHGRHLPPLVGVT